MLRCVSHLGSELLYELLLFLLRALSLILLFLIIVGLADTDKLPYFLIYGGRCYAVFLFEILPYFSRKCLDIYREIRYNKRCFFTYSNTNTNFLSASRNIK